MVGQELNQGDEILDVAIQHLRQQPIPEFPNPSVEFPIDLEQRQRVKLAADSMSTTGNHYSGRRSLLAMAAVVAIVLGSLAILPWENASQKAYAQVQEAMRNLNSLVFDLRSYSGDQVTMQGKIAYTKSGDVRLDSGLAVHVLNAAKAEYMIVDDAKRTVTIQPVYDVAAIQQKILGEFTALLNLGPLPSTTMRTITKDGKLAKEFKAVWDGSVATVVVDAKTNLPMTIESDRGKNQDGQLVREIASNFQFNVSLPDSSFAIIPPQGYVVNRIARHDPIKSSTGLVLTAGTGLGPIHFGMSLQEVRNELGDPDSFESKPALLAELDEKGQLKMPMKLVPANPPQLIGVMQYRTLGVQIEVSSIAGVEWIRCYEKRMTWAGFEGMTSHGIRIGMTKDEAKSLVREEPADRRWKTDDDRWLLKGMDVVFENGKCVEITIGKPAP